MAEQALQSKMPVLLFLSIQIVWSISSFESLAQQVVFDIPEGAEKKISAPVNWG